MTVSGRVTKGTGHDVRRAPDGRRACGALLATTLLLAVVATTSAAQAPMPAAGDAVLLRPGDALRITVWRNPEVSGELEVGADGTLVHPFYRDVQVAGVPAAEVERRLAETLRRIQTDPQFAMQPLVRVTVTGEVGRPGLARHPIATTVADALALAGGPTDRARVAEIRLMRDGAETRLDLTEPAGLAARMPIRSGDLIVVPRRSTSFRDTLTFAFSLLAAAASVATLAQRR